MYGQDILYGISKGTFKIPHKISYPYIERYNFHTTFIVVLSGKYVVLKIGCFAFDDIIIINQRKCFSTNNVLKYIPHNLIGNKWSCRVWHLFFMIPRFHRRYTGFALMSVRPSICPSAHFSVSRQGFTNFAKKICWLNSFDAWHITLWHESLDPYIFSCS